MFLNVGRQTCDVNVSIYGAAIPVVESTRDLGDYRCSGY